MSAEFRPVQTSIGPVLFGGDRSAKTSRPVPSNSLESGRVTPASRPTPALGAVLVDKNLLTTEQLELAIERQRTAGGRLGQVLIELGFTTRDAVLGALSLQLGVPATRLNGFTVSHSAVQALPEKVARKHLAVPLHRVGGLLQVAIASPTDLAALDDLRFASGCQIQLQVALEDEIHAALDRFYARDTLPTTFSERDESVVFEMPVSDRRHPDRPDRRRGTRGRRRDDIEPAEDFDAATLESAVQTVDRMLARAAAVGASDIHLEPTPESLRVRFRVDGTFQDVGYISMAVAPAICVRVKVLAGMDIAEHRLPQDGRLSMTVGTRRLDLRAATYPTIHGEKVVMRVLDQASLRLELPALGMQRPMLDDFREVIRRPEGLVLITGPTGSGKTSTLYAALGELVETGKNITTIENPVEYSLAGTNQGQINEKAGFTFVRGLRAVLRQDPDIIMVGEIRDSETLTTAIEASLTGHLVFSTLHTNSAIGTITRLVDMGIEPYFLASGVLAIVAQRLVRRICAHCTTALAVPSGVATLFGEDVPEFLHRGVGCTECRGTGFSGRVAIYEMVRMTTSLREQVLSRVSEAAMLRTAREQGTRTLREECLARVREGLTTLEEVVRVTQ